MIEYTLIRSRRRTISIEIDLDASIIVRCPMRTPKYEVERFITEKDAWIRKHVSLVKERNEKAAAFEPISQAELKSLYDEARRVIPERVGHYASLLGVTYARITIRNQKTLWGSCSRKGNLNFNCMLMKAPERVRDYVIVHELCHRIEMNHSARFWAHVESLIPDHKQCRKWLREEGSLLISHR